MNPIVITMKYDSSDRINILSNINSVVNLIIYKINIKIYLLLKSIPTYK